MVGYCNEDDVRHVMQETETKFWNGSLEGPFVSAAIESVSDWLHRRANAHWYDSTLSSTDTVSHQAASASNVRVSVPSSPHQQGRQIPNHRPDAKYPKTTDGPYARIQLPHASVTSLTKLEVRDLGGGVTDWVGASDKTEGRGDDYYLETTGPYDASYLSIRASSIGPRRDYNGLLSLTYDYGVDKQTESWDSIRQGVASLAAAELVMDDDVKTAIPNDGQLIAVETKADRLVNTAMRHLKPYLRSPIA